mmetsp:Transcript_43289/g.97820  ORF Transcript_43289/g.97820 Transcript_43289/m.97820 type:complete len:177 (-) Transcript_43289:213-743(-)
MLCLSMACRELVCVVGPYWQMMLFCTTPLILAPCIGTIFFMAPLVHPALTTIFALASLFVITMLWKTATTDPGLLVRTDEDPEEGQSGKKKKWAWDDRTKSWRPVSARFVEDCGVLVADYDHTCPWTGTAIGAGNIKWFYMFTGSLLPLIIFCVVCLVIAFHENEKLKDDDIGTMN